MTVKSLNTAVGTHRGFKPLETRRDQKALEQAKVLTTQALAPASTRYDAGTRAQDLAKAQALLSGAAKGGVTVRQQALYGEVVTALDGAQDSFAARKAKFQGELDALLDGNPELRGAFRGQELVKDDPARPGHVVPTEKLDGLAFGPTSVPYRVIDFDYPEHEECSVGATCLADVAKALDRDLLAPVRQRNAAYASHLDGLRLQRLGLEQRTGSSGLAVDQALTRLQGAGYRAHPERQGGDLEVSVELLRGSPVGFIQYDERGRWKSSVVLHDGNELLALAEKS